MAINSVPNPLPVHPDLSVEKLLKHVQGLANAAMGSYESAIGLEDLELADFHWGLASAYNTMEWLMTSPEAGFLHTSVKELRKARRPSRLVRLAMYAFNHPRVVVALIPSSTSQI